MDLRHEALEIHKGFPVPEMMRTKPRVAGANGLGPEGRIYQIS